MNIKQGVIFTKKDHQCNSSRCRKLIPAGSKALRVIIQMFTPNKWGNEIPVKVPVHYHLGHRPKGLGQSS